MARPRPARPQPQDPSEQHLSEAARAVVHDAGDPRIDAHLAALGLGPEPTTRGIEPGPVVASPPAAASVDAASVAAPVLEPGELEALRARVVELEGELSAARRRSGLYAALLAIAALLIIVLGAAQLQ